MVKTVASEWHEERRLKIFLVSSGIHGALNVRHVFYGSRPDLLCQYLMVYFNIVVKVECEVTILGQTGGKELILRERLQPKNSSGSIAKGIACFIFPGLQEISATGRPTQVNRATNVCSNLTMQGDATRISCFGSLHTSCRIIKKNSQVDRDGSSEA